MTRQQLRPLEAVVLRLREDGATPSEIGRRIGKKPGTVERIVEMVDYRDGPVDRSSDRVRPVERVVLKLRADGESYTEIGHRMGRSGRHIRNIEKYARFKLDGID